MPIVLAAAFAALYFWSRARSASRSDGDGGERVTLIPGSAPTAETRESFFAGDRSGREWWPDLQTSIDDYMRDLFSGGELAPFAAAGLPPGWFIEPLGGAESPLVSGARVAFTVRDPSGGTHVLEGIYKGPSDPSTGEATVVVDRIAVERTTTPPKFGSYRVPASKFKGYHTSLAYAQWYALDPASVSIATFEETPPFKVGDRVTGAFRDLHGNIVIGVVTVKKRVGDEMEVHLDRVHRVVDDEGVGPIVFPVVYDQAIVPMRVSQMVNPKGL